MLLAAAPACIFFFAGTFGESWDRALATYVLPFAVAAAVLVFVVWRLHAKDLGTLTLPLETTRTLLEQREHEPDLAFTSLGELRADGS